MKVITKILIKITGFVLEPATTLLVKLVVFITVKWFLFTRWKVERTEKKKEIPSDKLFMRWDELKVKYPDKIEAEIDRQIEAGKLENKPVYKIEPPAVEDWTIPKAEESNQTTGGFINPGLGVALAGAANSYMETARQMEAARARNYQIASLNQAAAQQSLEYELQRAAAQSNIRSQSQLSGLGQAAQSNTPYLTYSNYFTNSNQLSSEEIQLLKDLYHSMDSRFDFANVYYSLEKMVWIFYNKDLNEIGCLSDKEMKEHLKLARIRSENKKYSVNCLYGVSVINPNL